MPDVRLVDLEVIKRFSLAVRRDTVPAEELLDAIDASRALVVAALTGGQADGAPTGRPARSAAQAAKAAAAPAKQAPAKRATAKRAPGKRPAVPSKTVPSKRAPVKKAATAVTRGAGRRGAR